LGPIAATIVTVEIGLLVLAGFAIFRSWEHTFAEAAAYALITTLMLLSCLFQVVFLIGNPSISIGAEVAFAILAVIITYRLRRYLSQAWLVIRKFVSGHPVAGTVLLICFGYLATQAFLIPPDSIHWENLGQVLRFQQHGTLFSTGLATGDQAFFPVNTIILPHLFLRFHTDMGIGLFGLMAYLSIGFSSFYRHHGCNEFSEICIYGYLSRVRNHSRSRCSFLSSGYLPCCGTTEYKGSTFFIPGHPVLYFGQMDVSCFPRSYFAALVHSAFPAPWCFDMVETHQRSSIACNFSLASGSDIFPNLAFYL
jgi:hypothetical protein